MSQQISMVSPTVSRVSRMPSFLHSDEDASNEIQSILSPKPNKSDSLVEENLSDEFAQLEIERRSISVSRQWSNASSMDLPEEDEICTGSLISADQIQQLADSILYKPRYDEDSGEVLFVDFWQRRGVFPYYEVYEMSQANCLAPLQVAVKFSKIQQVVWFKQHFVDGRIERRSHVVITRLKDEPTREFLNKNLTDLSDALDCLLQNQINTEHQFYTGFNTVVGSIDCLAKKNLGASGREVRLQERKKLSSLITKLNQALNSQENGLLAQHEIIQRRHEGFQIFSKAIKELESEMDKPILCPSLFRSDTLKYMRSFEKNGDSLSMFLAQFYKEYERLLVAHRAYFTQAISSHLKLINESNELIKQIDADLKSC